MMPGRAREYKTAPMSARITIAFAVDCRKLCRRLGETSAPCLIRQSCPEEHRDVIGYVDVF